MPIYGDETLKGPQIKIYGGDNLESPRMKIPGGDNLIKAHKCLIYGGENWSKPIDVWSMVVKIDQSL